MNSVCIYKKIGLIIIMIGLSLKLGAQTISFIPRDTVVFGEAGSELIVYIDLTNNSNEPQTVFIVRSIENLPQNWTSSLCFALCFAPSVDSVVTNQTYGSSPLQAGETREVSLHFFTTSKPGTGMVRLEAGTITDPNNRVIIEVEGSTISTSVEENDEKQFDFILHQNYPNPFNPSTIISYRLQKTGRVVIQIFDILGNEIKTLVDGIRSPGLHSVSFSSSDLPNGIYFYCAQAGDKVITKKMQIIK